MEYHIVVCIKSVVLETPRGELVRTSDTCGMNPFDKPALETGFRLKDRFGGRVTVLTMGPDSSNAVLHEAMSLGADRGILITDRALVDSDTLVTSRVLTAAIRKLAPYDLILFGTKTADSDTGHVGPQTAHGLQLPLVGYATDVDISDSKLQVRRTVDGFWEEFETGLPAVVTVRSANERYRYAPLSAIETVFRTDRIEKWSIADLGLSRETVGQAGSPTRLLSLTNMQKKKKCRMIEGTTDKQVESIIALLEDVGGLD